ncbi:MAG: DUF4412 domain-containing protein [Candidatus Eremiobacteraeota bacterium]|nr:DUF4412 domain-containing protein [Candidatus Eremiobacteraeota bacterium]MCW5865858.1 DUF4412 domain-containing protein [Candidatus Eremiobacteraeota bacterium]
MKTRFFLTSLFLGTIAFGAGADVRYTTKMGNAPAVVTTTTWVKGKRQRTEMVTDMGQMKTKTVTLTMCDQHQMVTLDTDLKIYYATPFGEGGGKAEGGQGTGTITNIYTVKDLGTEMVAQLKAHHWMVTTQTKTSGCAGNTDTTSKVEVWTAPVPVLNCPESAAYSQPTCKIKFVEQGDVRGMRAAYNGMPVKMITYQGNSQTSTMEFVDYSTAALADDLFAPPSDYKKVTATEFQQQQQQKMMQQFKVPGQ